MADGGSSCDDARYLHLLEIALQLFISAPASAARTSLHRDVESVRLVFGCSLMVSGGCHFWTSAAFISNVSGVSIMGLRRAYWTSLVRGNILSLLIARKFKNSLSQVKLSTQCTTNFNLNFLGNQACYVDFSSTILLLQTRQSVSNPMLASNSPGWGACARAQFA
jgi:hypothetical protein